MGSESTSLSLVKEIAERTSLLCFATWDRAGPAASTLQTTNSNSGTRDLTIACPPSIWGLQTEVPRLRAQNEPGRTPPGFKGIRPEQLPCGCYTPRPEQCRRFASVAVVVGSAMRKVAIKSQGAEEAEKRSAPGARAAAAGLGVIVLLLALAAAPPPAKRTPPNLVLITLDTTRADHLGAWGDRDASTPHLDALAARGTRFSRCDTAAPITLPSHATLLTGLFPPRHGVRDNGTFVLTPQVETLAERLAARGYDTAAVVSAVVLARRQGLDQGFRIYDDDLGEGYAAGTVVAERQAEK